ncbi:hypothetical protein [Frankia sp. AgPm24]|uniref:hypothetical protein n=1 Tax=Frankia sp. AgPm24 TaxID=631128 RepID=UPI00200F4E6D|nr:hypothetical protein [Frankia sp. AgPm24]
MTTSRLEIAYRRLLRCYPPRWRHDHEDELIATLLDLADATGRTRPSPADIADLVVHGLATRLGASLDRVPVVVRQRTAILALSSLAVLSAGLFVVAEVVPKPLPAYAGNPPGAGLTFGPFVTLGAAIYPLPVAALVAASAGARRTARVLLGLTCIVVCAAVLVAAWTDIARPPLYLLAVLFLQAGMASAGMPTALRRRDLFTAAALFCMFLAAAGTYSLSLVHSNGYVYYNNPFTAYRGPDGLVDSIQRILPATVLVGVAAATVISLRRPGWAVAVFVVGAAWSLMPIAESIRYYPLGAANDVVSGGFLLAAIPVVLAAVMDLSRAASPHGLGSAPARQGSAPPSDDPDQG